MHSGLQTTGIGVPAFASGPVFAQFGGSKNYYVDLILIVILFGVIVFLVGRSSRRN